ncbi:MAG: rhomboid family intramembrane serine protease [Planctomycetales bacterium]|nr:rhomboid family intramembrane serine protease [Planctomycetales bacterium]
MRQIGTLPNEQLASRLAAYLAAESISCQCEQEDGQWSVWVHDENLIETARAHLEAFRAEPDAARFRVAAPAPVESPPSRTADPGSAPSTPRRRGVWAQPPGSRAPFITTLILLSFAMSMVTGFGQPATPGSLPFNVKSHMAYVTIKDHAPEKDPLASLKKGQLWRLVTPIFPHLSLGHLLINMFFLYQFGRLLESKLGAPKLGFLVLLIAVVSNSAQAVTPASLHEVLGGPFFFGMSGVVYGLFGYAWIRGQVDSTAGFYIPPLLVFIMLGLMFLSMSPSPDDRAVANMTHVSGLVMGMVMAQFR